MSPARALARALLVVSAVAAASPAAADATFAWEATSLATPRVMWADRNVDVRVRLRNTGTATWSESSGDHLSYHWVTPAGTVSLRDGMRTQFATPVRPGETAEVTARVHAPTQTGMWVLEWEMVREGVRWYGAPTGGVPVRVGVRVVFRSGIFQIAFAVAGLGLGLAARLLPRTIREKAWPALAAVPVAWSWAGIVLVAVTFSEIAGWQLWRGASVPVASSAALLALPLALFPGRSRAWAAGALVVAASVVAFADAVYVRYFGSIVPVVAVAAVRQVGRVEGSVAALVRPGDGWLLVGAAGAVAFAVLWPGRRRGEGGARRARAVVAGALAAACLLGAVPAIRTLRVALRDPATVDQLFSQEALASQWGVVNAHLFDALRTWREWAARNTPDPAEDARARAFLARKAERSAADAARLGVARGANLILIQVESLQQWVIGARVGGAEITPYLDSLRGRALYFPFLFDETGQGRSSDGEFEALNSEHALDRGAVAFRRPRNHFVALPAVLRAHGYTTLSAHPFERGFWNRGILHPRYGFERMLFRRELGAGEVIGWGLADGVFFDRMVEPLRDAKQPYFAFLITLGLHHPFDLFPDQHKVLDVGALRGTPLGNYVHAMHYFDSSLAAFMAALERSGALANTVVAVYGDHEAGLWVDEPLLALAGEPRWEPSVLVRLARVPLFVVVPRPGYAGEVPAVGGHVDIAPTLLALLGIAPPPCWVGHVLDPSADSIAVLNDGSVVGDGHVFVAQGPLIPAGGACFAWPDGAPRPAAECRELERRGREELSVSRFVVVHDLAAKLAGFTAP